jgi:hypothetical protein
MAGYSYDWIGYAANIQSGGRPTLIQVNGSRRAEFQPVHVAA